MKSNLKFDKIIGQFRNKNDEEFSWFWYSTVFFFEKTEKQSYQTVEGGFQIYCLVSLHIGSPHVAGSIHAKLLETELLSTWTTDNFDKSWE